ncbi:hypothetical protein [Mycobacterium sp. NPDC006124]|uniref:hypothetical protein n=1 Tax=Mycobacterium sp. NPDC006124 TaxID=3156729 RepID=UPI0033A5FDE5
MENQEPRSFEESFDAFEKATKNLIGGLYKASNTGPDITFRRYLQGLTIDDADEDDEIDPEATREQLLAVIEPYGFTLDDVIPAGFYEVLRKSL